MSSAQEAREARRRKILARGSDRLDFITGKLPSISSSPSLAPVAPADGDLPSSPTSARTGDSALIRLVNASPPSEHDQSRGSVAADFDASASTRVLRGVRQQLRAIDHGSEGVSEVLEGTTLPRPDGIANQSYQGNDPTGTEFGRQPTLGKAPRSLLRTCRGFGLAIDVTENYRTSAALFLALFIILHRFFSWSFLLGEWIVPWPAALIIVTDVSLVVGALILALVRTPNLFEDDGVSLTGYQMSKVDQMASKLEYVLGIGEVIMKAFRALFLDGCIYIVAVVIGYSLLEIWQPLFEHSAAPD